MTHENDPSNAKPTGGTSARGAGLSRQELQAIAIQSGVQIMRYDLSTQVAERFYNAPKLYGVPIIEENVPESVIARSFVSEDTVDAYRSLFTNAIAGKPSGSADAKIRLASGEYRWHHADYALIYDDQGEPTHAILTFHENSAERELQFKYAKWRSGLSALLEESILYTEANITKNEVDLQEGTSFYRREGDDAASYDAFVHYGARRLATDTFRAQYLEFFDRNRLINLFSSNVHEDTLEYSIMSEAGEELWLRANVRMNRHPSTDDILLVIAYADIDQQHKEFERLAHIALRDPLTQILNRSAMESDIERRLDRAQPGELLALFIIDLDNFKLINDTFGHQQGDTVLRQTADALTQAFDAEGIIGRLGGDEFVAFVSSLCNEYDAIRLADRVVSTLQFCIRNNQHAEISASVGVALTRGGCAFDKLYQQADEALYLAKRAGKCQYHIVSVDQADSMANKAPKQKDLGLVQLHSLLEHMDAGIALGKVDKQEPRSISVVYDSPSYFKSMGYTEELAATNQAWLLTYVVKSYLPGLQQKIIFTADTGEATEYLYQIQLPEMKQPAWRYVRLSRIPGDDKDCNYVIAAITDLSNIVCVNGIPRLIE